jgi:hypothetical protein
MKWVERLLRGPNLLVAQEAEAAKHLVQRKEANLERGVDGVPELPDAEQLQMTAMQMALRISKVVYGCGRTRTRYSTRSSEVQITAGIFNPAFATYRMNVTADTHLSRVVGTWAMTNKVVQPACIAAAGLLAATAGIRTAIAVLSVVLLCSAALLPWTALRHHSDTTPHPPERKEQS